MQCLPRIGTSKRKEQLTGKSTVKELREVTKLDKEKGMNIAQ